MRLVPDRRSPDIALAREAVHAAHAGDCAQANALAARLREIDDAFYDPLIAADRPLASCR